MIDPAYPPLYLYVPMSSETISHMDGVIQRHKEMVSHLDAILKLDPDKGTQYVVEKLRERLRLPMAAVMEKFMPGQTIQVKVETLRVSRQAYYEWVNGLSRPAGRVAKQIARATGLNADDIRGKLR